MAAAPQVKRVAPPPVQPMPQPVQQHEEIVEEEHEEPEVTQQVIHQARTQAASARMPQPEDFPPIAQRQIAAQQNRIENIAEHAAKKKRGLFERLAGVGLSRKGDLPAQGEAEPRQRQEPRIPASEPQRPQVAQMPTAGPAQPVYDDDQLEIPAFLRRQAN
jgi:cell division protein FtsZ